MTKFYTHKATGRRGFSEWTNPTMTGYLMACCDCGLVHEMEFKVFKITKRLSKGRYVYDTLPRPDYRVTMRARRAAGHTAALRKQRAASSRIAGQEKKENP